MPRSFPNEQRKSGGGVNTPGKSGMEKRTCPFFFFARYARTSTLTATAGTRARRAHTTDAKSIHAPLLGRSSDRPQHERPTGIHT